MTFFAAVPSLAFAAALSLAPSTPHARRAHTILPSFTAPTRSLFDPFRRTPAPKPARQTARETAQASDAQDSASSAAMPNSAATTDVSPAAPSTTPFSGATPSCVSDSQCQPNTICDEGECRPFELPLNVLLFRKSGPYTQVLPFYWARRGNPGHRVVAPLYWHFWSPEGRSHVVAPFYFHFDDHTTRRTVNVIWAGLPISWTRQPGASSFGVWPLFYKSSRFGWAAPLLGSFRVQDPDAGRAFGLYGFLYYNSRDHRRARAFDLFFPFVVSSRSKQQSVSWVFPLNFHWRDGKTRNLLILPLFYRRADDGGGVFASLLGYQSRTGNTTRGSLFWLYWFGRASKGTAYDVLFPLIWSFRAPNSTTTVAGPFVSIDRPTWSFTTLFPLYFRGRNAEKKSAFSLLLPFYFSKSTADNTHSTWLTPFGSQSVNTKTESKRLTFWLPPIFAWRDRQLRFDMWLGLYWRRQDRARDTDTWLAGLLYHTRDPEGSTTTLFPLYWRFSDTRTHATATLFFPFFFRRSGPDRHTFAAGIFPLLLYRSTYGTDGDSTGLFPLAFFGRDGARRHAFILPLFFHTRDARATFTLAAPFFYHRRDKGTPATGPSHATGILPLLYFQGADRTGSYRVQFPFFWRFSETATQSTTTVIPPGFWHSRPGAYSAGLLPFLFAGRDDKNRQSHFVLFPFFWRFSDNARDRHTTVVGPYWQRRHGDEATYALFPFFHYRAGAQPGRPAETSLTLFPLFHYQRTPTRSVFASPLAAWSSTPKHEFGFVLPYFWYRNQELDARGIPLLWLDFTRKREQQRTRIIGPYVAVDEPGHRARFFLPFFGRYANAAESGIWFLPSYFRLRRADGYAVDTLFPFYWRSTSPGHSTTQVGPWFSRTTPEGRATGLIPFYLYTQNRERSLLLTPLSYAHHDFKTQTTTHSAALLFYHSRSPQRSRTILFPLWFSGHNRGESHHVLFPLFWHLRSPKHESQLTILGPLFYRRIGSEVSAGLFPLLWASRDPVQGAGSHTLLPLFHHSYKRSGYALYTPFFGRGISHDSNWWYVPPVFRRTGAESETTLMLPLWLSHENRATRTHTRVVLPLLHFSHESPERGISSFLALFWRHRDIASSTSVLFPLFFDHHSFYESRTTAFLPLFLRHHRVADETTYTIAPLFYRRTDAKSGTTIVFPLLWDFKQVERRTTLFLPFFGRVDRPGYTATYVFPTFYYRSGKGESADTYRFIFFPFWESAAKRRGDTMWEVLLGLFGYERIGRNRFVKLLFIPFEIAPAPRASTAWYGGAPKPTVTPGRGFSGHIW